MRYIILILCVCWILVSSVPGHSAEHELMPAGFESLELGMDWNTFLHLRPQVEIFNVLPEAGEALTPDPDFPQEGLLETFPEGSEFSTGLYGFEDGHLVAIMLGKPLDAMAEHRNTFLRKIAQKYGLPATISLMKEQKTQGVMIWQKYDAQVLVIVPINTGGEGFLTLRIMTQTYAAQLKDFALVEETDGKQMNADMTAIEALRQEMTAYIQAQRTPEEAGQEPQKKSGE